MYHRVIREGAATQYAIPEALLRDQLAYLAENGFTTVLPDAYRAFLEAGTPLPAKPVMLTFDDWRPEHFEIVRPLLDELGFKAVFFVHTDALALPADGERLRTLIRDGHVIGAHTVHHYYLTQEPCDEASKCCRSFKPCSPDEVRFELTESKRILEGLTGVPVTSFAWPGGFYSESALGTALQAGFTTTFAVDRQSLEGKYRRSRVGVTSTPRLIFRTEIDGHCGMQYFPKAVESQRCCVSSPARYYRYCVPRL